jgi:thymidylate synthase
MECFESKYRKLITEILINGKEKYERNGITKSIFGYQLEFDAFHFPAIMGRKYPYKAPLGEFAALIKGPKHLKDFEKFGCNYWKKWANSDGSINLDYGNAWINWNGINQIEQVLKALEDGGNRRMIVTGWNPEHLPELSLPCCHWAYQFNLVGNTVDMIWIQRSVDTMLGLPADAILAWVFLTSIVNTLNNRTKSSYKEGKVIMQLGNVHIYKEHLDGVREYLSRPFRCYNMPLVINKCKNIYEFTPDDVEFSEILLLDNVVKPIKFLLKE